MSRLAEPERVGYFSGTRFSHRQLVNPQPRHLPEDVILGERREHIDCRVDAIIEALARFHSDEHVSIAAGALRSVFGDAPLREMGIPDQALDHKAVLMRVGTIRELASHVTEHQLRSSDNGSNRS